MTLTFDLTFPFYGGRGIPSGGVGPGATQAGYEVALGGHGYIIDTKANDFHHVSIPMLRQQADQSSSPAEASLNPDDLWRRAQDSWHRGAGQEFRDRPDADPNRFRASKGIDPWTRYSIGLLKATALKRANSTQAIVCGSRLYSITSGALEYTSDVTVTTPTFTAVTGGSPGTFVSMAADGTNVYITDGTDVYSTTTASSTKAIYNALNCTVLGYVKGRLMAAQDNSIYNITDGTPPAALYTHGNTSFDFVGFAEGNRAIYTAGFAGDKSLIFKINIKEDGSGLDAPVVAGSLPDGEIIRSIGGYLGNIVLGTDQGWRFCLSSTDGDLEIGALVETPFPVRCFEGQTRFIWYGLEKYDGTSSGLGRMDITQINEGQVPAWASDLMATVQASVLSVVTFQEIRVFCAGSMYAETTSLVSEATIETGTIGFGLPDQKIGLFFDVNTDPLDGSYSVSISSDTGPYVLIGSDSEVNSQGRQLPIGEIRAERFEARITLSRAVSSPTDGPRLVRWTMKAAPAVELREYIYIPVLLHDTIRVGQQDRSQNVSAEVEFIKGLRKTQMMTVYQEGTSLAYSGQVTDYDWQPYQFSTRGTHFEGTMIVKFRRIT